MLSDLSQQVCQHLLGSNSRVYCIRENVLRTHRTVICDLTERQNHARDLVRSADLTQWDALVVLSGDGLLFEVCADRLCPSLSVCVHSAHVGVCVCVCFRW